MIQTSRKEVRAKVHSGTNPIGAHKGLEYESMRRKRNIWQPKKYEGGNREKSCVPRAARISTGKKCDDHGPQSEQGGKGNPFSDAARRRAATGSHSSDWNEAAVADLIQRESN